MGGGGAKSFQKKVGSGSPVLGYDPDYDLPNNDPFTSYVYVTPHECDRHICICENLNALNTE